MASPVRREQKVTENIISALLFLPVIYQYEELRYIYFCGDCGPIGFCDATLSSFRLLGVIGISSASLMVTVIWHRALCPSIFWRPFLFGLVGALQMTFLVLSHAGGAVLLGCGVYMTAAVGAGVLVVAGLRRALDFSDFGFRMLIIFLSLVPLVLEGAIPS